MSKYVGRIITDQAPAGYSVAFDGSGDYINTADNSALDVGSSSFTFECWFFNQQNQLSGAEAGVGTIATKSDYNGSNSNGWVLFCYDGANNSTPSTNLTLFLNGVSFALTTSANAVPFNVWTHIAVVKSGTTVTIYSNGVSVATSSSAPSTINDTNTGFYIGSQVSGTTWNATYPMRGYISNARLVKGTALYTAAFTPPTQLLNVTNTSLLTCNSPAIVDQSSNAFAITTNGNAAVSTFTPFAAYNPYNPALGASTPGVWTLDEAMQAAATRQWNMYDPYFQNTTLLLHGSPPNNAPTWITDASTNSFAVSAFGGASPATLSPFSTTTYPTSGSGYFDGTGDYLTVPANAAFDLGTGDFTIECWFYYATTPPTGYDYLWALGGNNVNGLGLYIQNGVPLVWNGSPALLTTGSIAGTTWYHIAVVRSSGTLTVYLNGTSIGSVSLTSNLTGGGSLGVNIAKWINIPDPEDFFGYISNFRIVKGTAVYTSNFTPLTAPLTAIANTSLLTLQTGQAGNNNFFLDSSNNKLAITRNGSMTQGSFTPFSQVPGAWSNYFDGSGDALTTNTTGGGWQLGTLDFEISFWIYPQSVTGNRDIFTQRNASGTPQIFLVNNVLRYNNALVAGILDATITIITNKWQYCVLSRVSGVTRWFIDGVAAGSVADTNNWSSVSSWWVSSTAQSFQGYISNLRLVKGSGVTSSTVPTAPLTAISGTTFLSCQNNRFIDNSNNGFALTANGDVSVQPFSPYYPTAAYAPQTIGGGMGKFTANNYLTLSNSEFNFGTNSFTVDFWLYYIPSENISSYGTFFDNYGQGVFLAFGTSIQNLIFYGPANGDITGFPHGMAANTWNYLAFVRNGTTLTIYVNGNSIGSWTGITGSMSPASGGTTAYIGTYSMAPASYPCGGYISNFRVTKNVALYTSNFTPPTAPTVATASTTLLLNGTNAGIVDSTAKNVLETVGNAQISTAVSKFGGSSMYFDGSGDWLLVPSSQNFNMGTGDWTVECWAYASTSTARGLFHITSNHLSSTATGIGVGVSTSSGNPWRVYHGTTAADTGTNLVTTTWIHVAFVRSGSSVKLYLDGTSVYTATDSSNLSSYTYLTIGAWYDSDFPWRGYIDDLRITKGVARYTANFTPQTSQWQDQ